jgi:DNA-binding NarL/FixJ family response regulator
MIRVAIIEDEPAIREGLASLIHGTPGYQIAGKYFSMEEALPNISRQPPDVVLVDIELPGDSGIEGIRRLKEDHPALPLLVLTIYDDDERIFEALCAGACGYLLKKTPPAKLLESIREVIEGGAPMSPEVARRAVALFRDFAPPQKAAYHLTPHELRVLKLLAEGHTYKSAASKLGVAVPTVWFHLRKIYEKLQVHSKSEAVAKALRQRLVR